MDLLREERKDLAVRLTEHARTSMRLSNITGATDPQTSLWLKDLARDLLVVASTLALAPKEEL